jgi:RNA polymerase sigma-70 factor (ECF subfamily)
MGSPRPQDAGPSDAELVVAAHAGNVAALGLLLERHRPRLFATALFMLGFRPDAEDAVQETLLIALQRIGDVRDPGAAGAWLQTVVRRVCLQLQRRRRGEELVGAIPEMADQRASVEERIERLESRDWIWNALAALPEPLRVTAMLRYFGSFESYEELAAILGVPVGTIRSRLSEAKVKLGEALLAAAHRVDCDARHRSSDRGRFWTAAFGDIFRRGDTREFISHFERDLAVDWSNGKRARGREHLAAEIEGDLAAGVRLDVSRVLANEGVVVVEGRFANPPESPDHCPPGIALVLFESDARARGIRMHLAPRPPRTGED